MRKLLFTNLKTSAITFSTIFIIMMMSVFSILGLITINVRDDIANSSESELSEDASVVSNNMAQIGVDSLLFKNIVESFAENNNNF